MADLPHAFFINLSKNQTRKCLSGVSYFFMMKKPFFPHIFRNREENVLLILSKILMINPSKFRQGGKNLTLLEHKKTKGLLS